MPLISQLNVGKRAKSFLENVLEQHDPTLEKTLEHVAPLVDAKMFKAAPNLGRVSERELKGLLKPFWDARNEEAEKIMVVESRPPVELHPTETVEAPPPISSPHQGGKPMPVNEIRVVPKSVPVEQRQMILCTWTSPAETFPVKPTVRASALNHLLICPKRLGYMQYEMN